MQCTLLGSGGHLPLPERFLTSVAVRLEGASYLFDAGECTQVAFRRAKLTTKPFKVLAISHMHGDHCLGIVGLIMLRSQSLEPGPLAIIGPPGLQSYVSGVLSSVNHTPRFEILFREWEESSETAWEDDSVLIRWLPLKHRIFCLGYRLEEHPRPGKFNAGEAEKLGVPPGPVRADLQKGRAVTLENGTVVMPSQVQGPLRPGRTFAYATDTSRCKNLYHLCNKADIVFIEGTFHPDESAEADRTGHMTVAEAARIAGRAGAKRTILVHLSPRYHGETDLERLNRAARDINEASEIGVDSAVYPITASPS
jgi:ribonuclease Z